VLLMKNFKDSFEIQEAIKLLDELISQSAVVAPATPGQKKSVGPPSFPSRSTFTSSDKTAAPPVSRPEPFPRKEINRGDRLESTLFDICQQRGFKGALVANAEARPLAAYNSPVGDEAIVAFTMVLGDALDQVGKLLDHHDPNTISLDINDTEKTVLHRFLADEIPYFIMITCPREMNEKGSVELAIGQVASILKQV
jgi:hypothetical protein